MRCLVRQRPHSGDCGLFLRTYLNMQRLLELGLLAESFTDVDFNDGFSLLQICNLKTCSVVLMFARGTAH
jgi:hypothetical protein